MTTRLAHQVARGPIKKERMLGPLPLCHGAGREGPRFVRFLTLARVSAGWRPPASPRTLWVGPDRSLRLGQKEGRRSAIGRGAQGHGLPWPEPVPRSDKRGRGAHVVSHSPTAPCGTGRGDPSWGPRETPSPTRGSHFPTGLGRVEQRSMVEPADRTSCLGCAERFFMIPW